MLWNILNPERKTKIVDIGSNPCDGSPPYEKMLQSGIADVTGFEPQKEVCEKLISEGKYNNCEYLPYAIGDGNTHTLNQYKYSGLASLLQPDIATFNLSNIYREQCSWEIIKKTRIRTKRLDDINNIKYIDLLKIDTQGSELNILTGGEQILKNTLCIQLEVSFIPLYKGQPSFGEIDVFLRKHGFLPHCIAEQKNIMLYPVTQNIFGSNQLFEMDMVYLKDFRDMTIFTEEQLKQIALIMHYCYNSIDMVIRTLKTLDDIYGRDCLEHYIALSGL